MKRKEIKVLAEL